MNLDMVAAGVTNLVMSSYGDKISLIYDEINVYGPMTRYGVLDTENNEFALSNLITEGFTMGYATTKEESITLVSSSSTLSFKTIVSLEADEINAKEKPSWKPYLNRYQVMKLPRRLFLVPLL